MLRRVVGVPPIILKELYENMQIQQEHTQIKSPMLRRVAGGPPRIREEMNETKQKPTQH